MMEPFGQFFWRLWTILEHIGPFLTILSIWTCLFRLSIWTYLFGPVFWTCLFEPLFYLLNVFCAYSHSLGSVGVKSAKGCSNFYRCKLANFSVFKEFGFHFQLELNENISLDLKAKSTFKKERWKIYFVVLLTMYQFS